MDRNPLLRKGLAVGIILLFVGTCVIPSFAQNMEKPSLPKSAGKTIYVDDNNTMGPWDGTLEHPYRYIQDGVNASKNGDTVYVFNGSYHYEFFEIKRKSIQLLGEDQNTTFFTGFMVIENVRGFTLSGFTFCPDQYWDECIGIGYSLKCVISGNIFKGKGNIGTVCFDGSFLFNSIISSNTFEFITKNSLGIGLILSRGNVIKENRFIGNPLLEIGYRGDGVNIGTSSNNVISGNFFANLTSAFVMGSMFPLTNRNNFISNNTIINCGDGITLLTFSSNNIVTENNILNSRGRGDGIVLLDYATRNLIYKNTISNNEDGIFIGAYSSGNKIIANTISDNRYRGIYLPITTPPSNCVFNIFYYNNFERNSPWNAEDHYINLWYKPEGLFRGKGNYWDDYTGNDNNGDGIGDTPYNIPGRGNKDRYPLMEPVDIKNVTGIGDVFHGYADDGSDDVATYNMLLSMGSSGVFNSLYRHHQYSETNRDFDLVNKIHHFFLK